MKFYIIIDPVNIIDKTLIINSDSNPYISI